MNRDQTISMLTLLAKMYEEQSQSARGDGEQTYADFYAGAASACRVALLMLVPTDVAPKKNSKGVEKADRAIAAKMGDASKRVTPATAYPDPIELQDGWGCPECGAEYDWPQHLGMHRKRVHGVPSKRDLGNRRG